MIFNKVLLIKFFTFFNKKLTKQEISLLITGKGNWFENIAFQKQWKIIKKYQFIFQLIPGLSAVFLCNTTSFRAVNDNSDIDLFIVTKDNQLWITRIFTTCFIHILGLRRYETKIKNRFCLSFFATETGAFNLKDIQIENNSDPYLAIWTSCLDCLYARKGFLKKFQKKNEWIFSYNLFFVNKSTPYTLNPISKIIGNILKLCGIEYLFKKIFLKRIYKKQKNIKNKQGLLISDIFLKFHNEDIRWKIKDYLMNFL